ncbi:hypothetical protein [Desulfosarcina sp.]|uniref:hypothetical protein n=1 Tax=Desulfosarcina sp. TaxID=2027861 RepID=UPI0029B6B325|nr:hypothetical protein [Desulfosarcina sp.]MDX2452510.1 hypothetical protein [Desulfosarcina sp.]MDX2490284.1 hypothetical protein [Desulfosarcina sp.]
MINPSNINQIVQEILADIPLKEKAIIANIEEDKVPYLQYAFDTCIKDQLGEDDEMAMKPPLIPYSFIVNSDSLAFLFALRFIGHLTIYG